MAPISDERKCTTCGHRYGNHQPSACGIKFCPCGGFNGLSEDMSPKLGNSIRNRNEGAMIAENLRDLARRWENCPEVGMPHCDCITDAARFREMAARIMEMVGL